jgi:hypothetical protein
MAIREQNKFTLLFLWRYSLCHCDNSVSSTRMDAGVNICLSVVEKFSSETEILL